MPCRGLFFCDDEAATGKAIAEAGSSVIANRVPGKRDLPGEHPPLIVRARHPVINGEAKMAWKAPKIVEVSVGMEINMYMCANRK